MSESVCGRSTAFLCVVVALPMLVACGDGGGHGSSPIDVDVSTDPVVLQTSVARVEIARGGARLAVYDRTTGEPYTRGTASGSLFYRRSGERQEVLDVVGAAALDDGVSLFLSTSDGVAAQLDIRFLTDRTLVAELAPGEPGSLTALGARWESPPDEVIYGLTERLRDSRPVPQSGIPVEDVRPLEVGSLNRRGEIVEMFVRPTFSVYAPFYQSSRGYGLAVAGTMPGFFDVANSDPGVIQVEFDAGALPENRRLRFEIFIGPEHATILDEYTALTGRPFVPPAWAFLNWRWRGELTQDETAELDGVEMNAEVVDDVTQFEQLDIPAGVYLFDRPVLAGNFGFARFEWDEQRLPNTDAMLEALRRRGYRLMTWSATWACGGGPADNGTEAQRLGYLAPGPGGPPNCADVGGTSFILDVTNPDARDWFAGKLADFLRAYDLDGIKLDRGEEHIPSEASDIWADGRSGREVHNDYVDLQTQVHFDALSQARDSSDFVLFTRAAYRGTQRLAVVWGGDTAGSESFGLGAGTDLGLRSAIISQQRAAFMGFPIWGSDTGGYYEFKDREVFARWIELSAFSGLMEIGGQGKHAPWDMPTEPRYDVEMIEIYRRYTQLRQALNPYIVAAARQAGESGLPIVRPMVFLDRSDPQLRDLWDQYLFGPDLMVAPVWRVGERERQVYFPAGEWRSLWDESERQEGPATVTVPVPLDVIPVYVRGEAPSPLPPSGG